MPRIKLLRLFNFSTQETMQNSKKTSQCGSATRTADGSSRITCIENSRTTSQLAIGEACNKGGFLIVFGPETTP